MAAELSYEHVVKHVETGRLEPFYLFYGSGEFLREAVLSRIRDSCVDDATRDLNLRVFYGDRDGAGKILDYARTLPFMAFRRFAIVRRAGDLKGDSLDGLIPYLEDPSPTSCVIFVASSADFRKPFFKIMRDSGRAVHFRNPHESKIPAWIQKKARELGFEMDPDACGCLVEMVGIELMDLNSEIEKLALSHPGGHVGIEDVRKSAASSRSYTIFEVTDAVSSRRLDLALPLLRRFLEEEGRDGVLRLLGMISSQVGLLWRCKRVVQSGGGARETAGTLGVHPYVAGKLVPRARLWGREELEKGVHLLYRADGRIKSGADGGQVLERLLIALCPGGSS